MREVRTWLKEFGDFPASLFRNEIINGLDGFSALEVHRGDQRRKVFPRSLQVCGLHPEVFLNEQSVGYAQDDVRRPRRQARHAGSDGFAALFWGLGQRQAAGDLLRRGTLGSRVHESERDLQTGRREENIS